MGGTSGTTQKKCSEVKKVFRSEKKWHRSGTEVAPKWHRSGTEVAPRKKCHFFHFGTLFFTSEHFFHFETLFLGGATGATLVSPTSPGAI
jgi:hypothetical protein